MINVVNAEFLLYSMDEWPVEAFSKEMNIPTSSFYKIGDPIPHVNRKKVETAWKISRKVEFDISCPTETLKDILKEIEPKLEVVKQYAAIHNLSCVLYLHAIFHNVMVPNIQLDSAIIHVANELNAKLDLYVTSATNVAS